MIQMIHAKRNKEQAIELLKEAKGRTLEEQDHFRSIVDESMKQEGVNLDKPNLVEGGSEELIEKMKDCVYPPDDDERSGLLNLDWNQTLQQLKLNEIKDKDVRGYVYHLNRTLEHTQRIRAMAMFSERICTLDNDGKRLFKSWAKYSSCEILYQEAVEMGLKDEQLILTAWLLSLPIIMDAQASEDRKVIVERWRQATDTLNNKGEC